MIDKEKPKTANNWLPLPDLANHPEMTDGAKKEFEEISAWKQKLIDERAKLDTEFAELINCTVNSDPETLRNRAATVRKETLDCLQDELAFRKAADEYFDQRKSSLRTRGENLWQAYEKKRQELREGLEKLGFIVEKEKHKRRHSHCVSEEDTLDEHPEVAELLARVKQTRESQPKGLDNKKQIPELEHQIHEFLMLIAKL